MPDQSGAPDDTPPVRAVPYRLVAAALLALLGPYLLWLAQGPVTMARGDVFGDAYVMMAAQHFHEDGFLRCRLLPIIQPGELTVPPFYYTHQPPGPYITAGVVRALGVRSVPAFRVIPIILTVASLAFFYAAVETLVGSPLALLSALYLATTPALLYWADALDSYSYDEFFRFAAVFFWIKALSSDACSRRRFFVLTWLAAFAEALCSFAYILFIQVFIFAGAFLFRASVRKRYLLLFLLAPALAIGLHFAQNMIALGPADAFTDFRDAFLLRTLESGTADSYLSLRDYPLRLWNRVEHWFMSPVQALGFCLLAVLTLGRGVSAVLAQRFIRLLLLFAVAGSCWWIVFPEHSWIHHVTIRQFLPFFALLVGGVALGMIRLLRQGSPAGLRILGAALLGLLLVWQGHRVRNYTIGQRNGVDLAAAVTPVAAELPDNAVVFTNFGNHPTLAWLLDRPVFRAADAPTMRSRLSELYPSSRVVVLDYLPAPPSGDGSLLSPSVELGPDSVLVRRFGDFVLFMPAGRPPLEPSYPGDESPAR